MINLQTTNCRRTSENVKKLKGCI